LLYLNITYTYFILFNVLILGNEKGILKFAMNHDKKKKKKKQKISPKKKKN